MGLILFALGLILLAFHGLIASLPLVAGTGFFFAGLNKVLKS